MGQFYDEIPHFLIPWIRGQQVFWVATAPLSGDGHVNVSPKGLADSFHITDSHTVWYEDCTGSGAETIAHLRENGRITILFNAFNGPPRIARLFRKGTVYEFGTPEYERLLPLNIRKPGSRAALLIAVHKVGTSCGYAVPLYDFRGHRTRLLEYSHKKEAFDSFNHVTLDPLEECEISEQSMKWYWKKKNTLSMDGLPGLSKAFESTTNFQRKYSNYKPDDEGGATTLGYLGSRLQGFFDPKSVLFFIVGVIVSALYVGLVVRQ